MAIGILFTVQLNSPPLPEGHGCQALGPGTDGIVDLGVECNQNHDGDDALHDEHHRHEDLKQENGIRLGQNIGSWGSGTSTSPMGVTFGPKFKIYEETICCEHFVFYQENNIVL